MKKILVTGAAGFIGHHLISHLIARGDTVIGIDSISDFYDIRLKYDRLGVNGIDQVSENLKPISSRTHPNYQFIKLDISNREAIRALFDKYDFDIVCNLAAQASVQYSFKNPEAYIDSNLVGFGNLLEGCRHKQIKHLVYASSSSVYGLNNEIPFSEDDDVDHPISLYAATKRSNELMAYTYSHLYNLPTTGLRFFTVYGPWGRPDMAYFLFTKAILEKRPIEIYNNGNMSRDFTYIDDIIRGVVSVIDSDPNSGKDAQAKIYNIGNNAPVNLLEFVETIESELGIPANKVLRPMRKGDVYTTYADVTHMIHDFDFHSDTSIRQGIAKFIAWYKSYYKV